MLLFVEELYDTFFYCCMIFNAFVLRNDSKDQTQLGVLVELLWELPSEWKDGYVRERRNKCGALETEVFQKNEPFFVSVF